MVTKNDQAEHSYEYQPRHENGPLLDWAPLPHAENDQEARDYCEPRGFEWRRALPAGMTVMQLAEERGSAAICYTAEQVRAAFDAGRASIIPVAAPEAPTLPDAKDRHIMFLEGLVRAYGPKSLQYDIKHPNDGLNAGDAPEAPAAVSVPDGHRQWPDGVWRDRGGNQVLPPAATTASASDQFHPYSAQVSDGRTIVKNAAGNVIAEWARELPAAELGSYMANPFQIFRATAPSRNADDLAKKLADAEESISQYQQNVLELAEELRSVRAALTQQSAAQAPSKPLAHGHREDYYLLANARILAEKPIHAVRAMPNWVLASELFATGSTSGHQICVDAGTDPDGYKVVRSALAATEKKEQK